LDPVLFNLINVTGISLLLLAETRSQVFRNVLADRRRMRRNLAFLATSAGVGFILHHSVAGLGHVLPKLSWSAPLWLQLVLVFATAELFNWALHWAKHKNSFLWRLHCQHHRDDQYTVWLTTHTYAPEVLISGTIMGSALIVCGFGQLALDVYLLFYSLVNLYQHSAHPYSLGLLDRIIINPAYHRHHHGGAQVNFGSTLSIWDWVFGTVAWPKDRHCAINPPPVEQSPEPFGFVEEMLYPLRPSRWVDSRRVPERRQPARS
jgi:sterol desaturase/sphingolipid hydroxylase (fatty acid hydroxylase superfamily)